MGFGFRKSFGSGPFRFTVSPSGVSSSFGVRGARVTAGPRGTFVTVSSHGFYYRHRLDSGKSAAPYRSGAPQEPVSSSAVDSVFEVPIEELASSSKNELVDRLNAAVSATNLAPALLIVSVLVAPLFQNAPMLAGLVILVDVIATMLIFRRVEASHSQTINYVLDERTTREFEAIKEAVLTLGTCGRLWTLSTRASTTDLRRNAGANTLISRTAASVGELGAKRLKVSIPFNSIATNGVIFHFLPDHILVFKGGKYASMEYRELHIDASATRFIEEETVPQDSTCVGTTWKYVNKNGTPDRRFNNNRQIPVLQYGEVSIKSATGVSVVIQASSFPKSSEFAARMTALTIKPGQTSRVPPPRPEPPPREVPPPPPSSRAAITLLQCYEVLGITRPSTPEQAAAGYRHQASLYHPDKYEHLAPEMKTLASLKMQEINSAYSRVKLDIGII